MQQQDSCEGTEADGLFIIYACSTDSCRVPRTVPLTLLPLSLFLNQKIQRNEKLLVAIRKITIKIKEIFFKSGKF